MIVPPYGNVLVNRYIGQDKLRQELALPSSLPVVLGEDDLINLVNLASGCYSPLCGFMTEEEYGSVICYQRLPSGIAWTVPILLHIADLSADALNRTDTLVLLDPDNSTVGNLQVESVFSIELEDHLQRVYGTKSGRHPGVQKASCRSTLCVGGEVRMSKRYLEAMNSIPHFHTPEVHRSKLEGTSRRTFTAFSTRNVCHLGHEHLHKLALMRTDILGINVITGAQTHGSFLADVVFETYEYLIHNFYATGAVLLNNLRLPPIYAGPKEAFLQAIVLQNLGFTHFIVGRDHAGVGNFYGKYAAQEMCCELSGLSIEIVAIPEPRYCGDCGQVTTEKRCQKCGSELHELNGRDVRKCLLEKRYSDLNCIVRPEMRQYLTGMFEVKADMSGLKTRLDEPRQILVESVE